MPDHPDYQTPKILSDNPLRHDDERPADFLFEKFAVTLARLIADKTTLTPLTIGVSGTWGSGKTSLLRRVQRQLDQTRALLDCTDASALKLDFVNAGESPDLQYRVCRTVWFNAWKYADESELLVALVRVIVQTMADDGWVKKMMSKLLDPTYPRRDVVNTVLGWFSIKVGDASIGLSTGEPQPTVFAEKTAVLDLFDDAFDRLLAAWVHHKTDVQEIAPEQGVLVVFIDDLDRCLPAKAIQVLEAIKLFLDKPGCVFVLGADVELIQQAVEIHYQEIKGQKADDYLEKVIQLRFQLPPVVAETMQDYLHAQTVDAEMLSQWQTLIAAAEINPRRVKAVVNDIALQWAMLVNSGQARGVQRDDFIRWSALMRAAPAAFKKLIIEIDDDLEFRLGTVKKALQWAGGQGDDSLRSRFQEFEKDGRRLRKVLRQIGDFSPGFDAKTLDAFIHLTAPPPAPPPKEAVQPGEQLEKRLPDTLTADEGAGLEEAGRASRAAAQGEPGRVDEVSWGGILFKLIPAGKFRMGSSDQDGGAYDNEKPQHTVDIPYAYRIGRFPVTNAQFRAFIQARPEYKTTAEQKGSAYALTDKGWNDTEGADWRRPRGPKSSLDGKDEHPVVCVSWLDALEYCRWLNQTYRQDLPDGWAFRLPSEAEWEKAARGELGSLYPWGDQAPDEKRGNFDMKVGDTTPVGQYSPQGDSPFGCADMAGNVWEWTHSAFEKYPYQAGDGREKEDETTRRVLRGGSFLNDHRGVRCAFRYWFNPDLRYGSLGFRVCASPISDL